MAKEESKKEKTDPPAAENASAAQQQQQRPTVQINASNAISCYANFCRVTGTPEEIIMDIGLNTQPMGIPTEPIEISQRLIMNFFTAKRMLAALQMTIQRHEAAFGVLETDIQKRLTPALQAQAAQAAQAQAQARSQAK